MLGLLSIFTCDGTDGAQPRHHNLSENINYFCVYEINALLSVLYIDSKLPNSFPLSLDLPIMAKAWDA